jgi:hypothetical protein
MRIEAVYEIYFLPCVGFGYHHVLATKKNAATKCKGDQAKRFGHRKTQQLAINTLKKKI